MEPYFHHKWALGLLHSIVHVDISNFATLETFLLVRKALSTHCYYESHWEFHTLHFEPSLQHLVHNKERKSYKKPLRSLLAPITKVLMFLKTLIHSTDHDTVNINKNTL